MEGAGAALVSAAGDERAGTAVGLFEWSADCSGAERGSETKGVVLIGEVERWTAAAEVCVADAAGG